MRAPAKFRQHPPLAPPLPDPRARGTGALPAPLARAWNFTSVPARVHPKLEIGSVNDPAEHEADRIAAHVMGMPSAPLVRRKESPAAAAPAQSPPIVHQVLATAGRPLDAPTRAFFEPRLGRGLGDVRIHTDSQAAASARQIHAQAYTRGSQIGFAEGKYAPHSAAGRHLLAHELAHVVQHGEPAVRRQPDEPNRYQLTLPDSRKPHPSLLSGELGFHLLPSDRERLARFLKDGGLSFGPGLSPAFGGLSITLDALVEQARKLVLPIVPASEVEAFVLAEWNRVLLAKFPGPTPILPAPPPANFVIPNFPASQDQPDDLQSAAGVQWTWHLNQPNRDGKPERTVQFGLTRNDAEVYQFSLNLDTGDAQVLAGGQLQTKRCLFGKKNSEGACDDKQKSFRLEGSAFLQLLAGITTARGAASGSLTFQIQAGVGLTATFGPVAVTLQLAPSFTLQQGQPGALDFNVAKQGGQDKLQPGFPPFAGIPFIQGRF